MATTKCKKCGSINIYSIDSCNEEMTDLGCEDCDNKSDFEVLDDE